MSVSLKATCGSLINQEQQQQQERDVAIDAIRRASRVCQKVWQEYSLLKADDKQQIKQDASPVTVADYASQAVINFALKKHFPLDKVIAEESAVYLAKDPDLLDLVTRFAKLELPEQTTSSQILEFIGWSGPETNPQRYWTIDPVDGTKGFIRRGQYAVCLALIEGGQVQVGVLGCPNLAPTRLQPTLPSPIDENGGGCLLVATAGNGAFQMPLMGSSAERLPLWQEKKSEGEMIICESVDPGHSSHSKNSAIIDALKCSVETIRIDSQCKYGLIARGDADIYLRLPIPGRDYVENVWDHAAGALIVQEAGGIVSDMHGKPIDWSTGHKLSANTGVVAISKSGGIGGWHEKVTQIIKQLK